MPSREDLAEFSALVKAHLDGVIRYISFLSRETEEANDMAQEVFLKAWQQFDPRRKNSFRAWIMTITRNYVIDRHKRRGPAVKYAGSKVDEMHASEVNEVSPAWSNNTFCPEGLPAFAKLPVQHREIVFMRFVEQIPYGEMSQITGKSEEALRKIVSRAISAIRKEVAHDVVQQGE